MSGKIVEIRVGVARVLLDTGRVIEVRCCERQARNFRVGSKVMVSMIGPFYTL